MPPLKLYDKLKHRIRYYLLRHLPPCQQIVATISQSMDRELTLPERVSLKLHLSVCSWCQWYLEHLLLIRDATRAEDSLSSADLNLNPGPALSSEARERIRRNLTSNN